MIKFKIKKITKSTFTFFFLLLSLAGCSGIEQQTSLDISSMPVEELLIGWKEMLNTIKKNSTNPNKLLSKTFVLKLKLSGDWNLAIFPQSVFKVDKGQRNQTYDVTIYDSGPLFENTGGLFKMSTIWAELSKGGGNKGYVDINAQVECLYKVEFLQAGSQKINLEKLKEGYNYKFIVSHPELLNIYFKDDETIVFRKVKDGPEHITVRLQLTDKRTNELYSSSTIAIPRCTPSPKQPKNQDSIYALRKPGQCLTHLKTTGAKIDRTPSKKMYLKETFGNTCHLPIKCRLTARYGYIKSKHLVHAQIKGHQFSISPYSSIDVDTSWDFDNYPSAIDEKLYTASYISKANIPPNSSHDLGANFIRCEWGQ